MNDHKRLGHRQPEEGNMNNVQECNCSEIIRVVIRMVGNNTINFLYEKKGHISLIWKEITRVIFYGKIYDIYHHLYGKK